MPPPRNRSDIGLDSEELDSPLSLCSWGTGDGLADPFGQPSPHHGRRKAGQRTGTDLLAAWSFGLSGGFRVPSPSL